MQEENALTMIAKGPFSKFKEGGVRSILEELMARLRVLRRNQRVLNIRYPTTIDNYDCFQLFKEYELDVVDVVNTDTLRADKVLQENNFPTEFPLMMIDALETWVPSEHKPLIVAIKLSTVTLEEYHKSVELSGANGYVPVALVEGVVLFVRSDVSSEAGVKGINRRNFDIIFYDK